MTDTSKIGERESDFSLNQDTGMAIFRPNHQLMARAKLRNTDLKPELIFFYRRLTDDKIVYFSEGDAAMMMKSSHKQILRPLGCSTGEEYLKFIRNCGIKPGTLIPKAQAQKILEDALEAELAVAKGHYQKPQNQNVHFDDSFPIEQRGGFVPPK